MSNVNKKVIVEPELGENFIIKGLTYDIIN